MLKMEVVVELGWSCLVEFEDAEPGDSYRASTGVPLYTLRKGANARMDDNEEGDYPGMTVRAQTKSSTAMTREIVE